MAAYSRQYESAPQTALVTEGTLPVGAAIVRKLCKAGYRVAFASHDQAALEELEAELRAEGCTLLAFYEGMSSEKAIQRMFEVVRMQWGGINILLNNASTPARTKAVGNSVNPWQRVLQSNPLSLGICIREALKDMRKSEDGGHIVNIAASTPFKGKKSGEVPALSRFVVRELDNDLRRMVKNSEAPIRISAISPTQMLATKKSKDVPETRPEDVATAILQLISDGKEVASGPRKIESVSS